jgi:hypothetical protein
MEPIFISEKQTAVLTANEKEVRAGDYDKSKIDPKDTDVAIAKSTAWGSALITHEPVEQYQKQVYGLGYYSVGGVDGAHAITCKAEAYVYVGGGTRDDINGKIAGTSIITWQFRYSAGVVVNTIWNTEVKTNLISADIPK